MLLASYLACFYFAFAWFSLLSACHELAFRMRLACFWLAFSMPCSMFLVCFFVIPQISNAMRRKAEQCKAKRNKAKQYEANRNAWQLSSPTDKEKKTWHATAPFPQSKQSKAKPYKASRNKWQLSFINQNNATQRKTMWNLKSHAKLDKAKRN